MNVNFNKMLETLIFQRSCAQYLNTHPISINRLWKAAAAQVITISSYNNGLNIHVAICSEINAIYPFVLKGRWHWKKKIGKRYMTLWSIRGNLLSNSGYFENNKGYYSHNPLPFMKSNERRTAFSIAILDDLIVVLDMYSKAIFCSKVADHSRDMPNWHSRKFWCFVWKLVEDWK